MLARCELYWAPVTLLSPAHDKLLSTIERNRCMNLRRHEDRARFVLATALLRLAAGAWLHKAIEEVTVDRTCERCLQAHGQPRLPGTGLHASIAHADEYVAVALTDSAPVGVDIEQIRRVPYGPLLDAVCTAGERRYVRSDADFYAYWTRKESVLKATGVGLSLPMTDVVVTAPAAAPRVIAYAGEAKFVAQMLTPSFDARYACAVTVLTDAPIHFRIRSAKALLAGATTRSLLHLAGN